MKLDFNTEQLQLMADILSEQKSEISGKFLDRLLARDFRFDYDELEQLTDLLNARKNEILKATEETKDPQLKLALEQKKILIEGSLERISETFAMM